MYTLILGAKPKKPTYPIRLDKTVLTWMNVPVGRSEEQTVTLKNPTDEDIVVKNVLRKSEGHYNVITFQL